jgi:transketolase
LYPSDAVSCDKLVEKVAQHIGIVYIRTTRMEKPIIYDLQEEFEIGGSKTLRESSDDKVTVIAAGITLHEALIAYDELLKENIKIRVIDLYSIKPLDQKTLEKAVNETKAIITVEDHYEEGGIGEAVRSSLPSSKIPIYPLAVKKLPKSGKPQELLDYEEISFDAIIKKVKSLLK